jgi:ABC-type sugar transport system ATPase subunit
MDNQFVLEMEDIHKSFYGIPVLKGVHFRVRPGEVHVLLGENGAGKSTLMKILSGVYRAERGIVKLNGKQIHIENPAHSLNMGIGMVYQELSVVPDLTVVENIWLGNLPQKSGFIDWKEARQKTRQIFDDMDITVDVNARTALYDLGIQQLIEIFRVVSKNGRIIILDEPTSSLTDIEIEKLFETIRRLKKQGVSFIYITHKLNEVFEIGDYVTVLRDGSTVGETMKISGDILENDLITMMVGRTIEEQRPKEYNITDEVILEVRNFSDGKNFFDVSFDLHRGEVLGVAGIVGSGRTDLANALFGLGRKSRQGTITLGNGRYFPKSPDLAIKKHIGLITKDRKSGLLLHMPVSVNITIAKKEGVVSCGFRRIRNELNESKKYIELLRIAVDNSSRRRTRDLSGGNQQKVALARWICNGTGIFIMNEPTRGVDVGARVEVYKFINQITRNGGAVIMISSDMPELLGMSDNIIAVKKGRIVAQMDARSCTQEQIFEKVAGTREPAAVIN